MQLATQPVEIALTGQSLTDILCASHMILAIVTLLTMIIIILGVLSTLVMISNSPYTQ